MTGMPPGVQKPARQGFCVSRLVNGKAWGGALSQRARGYVRERRGFTSDKKNGMLIHLPRGVREVLSALGR